MDKNKCPECGNKLEWTRLEQSNWDIQIVVEGEYCPQCLYNDLYVSNVSK